VAHAREVGRILGDRRTTFCVVTTLEAAPVHEAEFFVHALRERRLHLGGIVLNKVLPASLLESEPTRAAGALQAEAEPLGRLLGPTVEAEPDQVARVLGEVAESFRNFQVVAKREAEQRAELGPSAEVTVAVPYFEDDITDVAGLTRLGRRLWSGPS
jgi:anion-transporting  ArsA/GET3 family ATPase